jgi:hypothetical protein
MVSTIIVTHARYRDCSVAVVVSRGARRKLSENNSKHLEEVLLVNMYCEFGGHFSVRA